MEIMIALVGFFILMLMTYVVVALFLPEWIGITGKKAHEVMKEQQESGSPPATSTTELDQGTKPKS